MTNSMTAFARTELDVDGSQLIWELRTVNHRYLDINLRLPEEQRSLEPECRSAISKAVSRGRVDAQLKIEKSGIQSDGISLDNNIIADLGNAMSAIENKIPGLQPARSLDVLRWPGVIAENPVDASQLVQGSMQGLSNALALLVENRAREGSELSSMISARISQCRKIVMVIDQKMPEIQQAFRDKLVARIAELGAELDTDRLNQEIVMMMTKSDVKEELDRTRTHLDEVERLLKASKAVGRSLDFIMQELNREANTLGSKAIDSEMSNASIDLKVLVEQMREQVQNIE